MQNTTEMTYEETQKHYSGNADPTVFFFAIMNRIAEREGTYSPDTGEATATRKAVEEELAKVFEYFANNQMVMGEDREKGEYYYTI